MTLTTDEKRLLRQALCDGAFNPPLINGLILRGPVSASTLEAVGKMTDEETRIVLRSYKETKEQELTQRINNLEPNLIETQNLFAAIAAIVIIPTPES